MAMTSNIKDFLRDTNKKIEKELEKQQSEGKKIIIEAHQLIVAFSPVDTGYFRANNFLTVNSPTDLTLNPDLDDFESAVSKTVSEANRKIKAVNLFKVNTVYIQNHLEYADRLEGGHSKQATGSSAIYGKTEQIVKRFLNQRIK